MTIRHLISLVVPLAAALLVVAGAAKAIRTEDIAEEALDAPPPCETVECATPLTDPPRFAPDPDFVPNVRLVAWASGVDLNPLGGFNDGGIYISREDGTQQRQLTVFGNFNRELDDHGLNLPDDHPSFSPDNRQIIFASNRLDKHNWEIWLMDVNGSDQQRLTISPGLDTEPVISPDGETVAWVSERFGNLDVVTAPIDDLDSPTQVTSSPLPELEPAWSPDGTRLVFSRQFGPGEKDIFTIGADGSGEHRVTSASGEDHDAVFSPDGAELLLTSQRIPFSNPFGNVYRVDAETGAPVSGGDLVAPADGDLTGDFANGAADPFISADGSKIAFFKSSFPVLGPTALFVMDANGLSKRHIPGHGSVNVHPAIGRAVDANRNRTFDYLESRTVGVASLRPRAVRAGRVAELRFGWRHPRAWKRLQTIDLRIDVPGKRTIASLRYLVADRLLSLQDPSTGYWGLPRRLGSKGKLEAGPLRVALGRSRLQKRSHKRLVVDLAVRLRRGACAGRRYRVIAAALGSDGRSQEEELGRLRIDCGPHRHRGSSRT